MPAEKHEHEHDHHSKESSAKLVTSHYGRNRRQPDHKERKIDGRRRSEQLTDNEKSKPADKNANDESVIHLQNGEERVMLATTGDRGDVGSKNDNDNTIKDENSNAADDQQTSGTADQTTSGTQNQDTSGTDDQQTSGTENLTSNADDRQTSGTQMSIDDDTASSRSTTSERSQTPFNPASNINHDNFDIRSFNSSISDFVELFSDPRYQEVDSDYPVDDLISVVSSVSASIDLFRSYTEESQRHLEDLRSKMKTVKENIYMSVTRQAFQIKDDDYQSIEERELTDKLATLNAACAKANAEVAEAVRLSAETESTAVKAQLSAERAKEEAKRIEEELERKTKIEAQRRAEEEQRKEEERKREEETRRKEEEKKRANEAEWRRRELQSMEKNTWDKWPIHDYKDQDSNLVFLIRGHPAQFEKNDVRYDVIEPNTLDIQLTNHEELIGHIIELRSARPQIEMPEPIYLAIPHLMTRGGAAAREPVMKTLVDGAWVELPTKEVTFDTHKDLKFAQAEVLTLSTFIITSRFKRDFVTFSRKQAKVTSSFDHRITLNVPRDTFMTKQHLLVQVQPVDSASVNDFRSRDSHFKSLLTSSPIVYTEWECQDFKNEVTITLPCPPNPAKARKLAQIRKMKEEKMKQPQRGGIATMVDQERQKEDKKQRQQAVDHDQPERKGQGRWYMGDYAATDDDENDQLYFVAYLHGKLVVIPEVKIIQAKLELVSFDISRGYEKFMVIRTRTNVNDDMATSLATSLTDHLSKRYAQVILKQKNDDPFEAALYMVPVNRVDRIVKQLSEEGYEDGPGVSHVLAILEGETIEVNFRGNIKSADDKPLELHFHSNLTPHVYFTVTEVDKYLQKNFPMFRGVVGVFRRYTIEVTEVMSLTRKEEDVSPEPQVKRDFLCDLLISIPKYHIEPSSPPEKAPITIHNTRDPVTEDYIHQLAQELGDEWRRVAHYLNVQRVRLQAILRNIQLKEKSEVEAKYDMLMTWLKRAPKSADKVAILSAALIRSGRKDLAEQVRIRELDFRKQKIGSR